MARINLLANAMRNAGVYTIPAQTIPSGITLIEVAVARNNWPDIGGDILKADIEASFDGGATWQYWVGFSTGGGVLTNKFGVEITESTVSIALPHPELDNRQLRATVELFDRIRMSADITLT